MSNMGLAIGCRIKRWVGLNVSRSCAEIIPRRTIWTIKWPCVMETSASIYDVLRLLETSLPSLKPLRSKRTIHQNIQESLIALSTRPHKINRGTWKNGWQALLSTRTVDLTTLDLMGKWWSMTRIIASKFRYQWSGWIHMLLLIWWTCYLCVGAGSEQYTAANYPVAWPSSPIPANPI